MTAMRRSAAAMTTRSRWSRKKYAPPVVFSAGFVPAGGGTNGSWQEGERVQRDRVEAGRAPGPGRGSCRCHQPAPAVEGQRDAGAADTRPRTPAVGARAVRRTACRRRDCHGSLWTLLRGFRAMNGFVQAGRTPASRPGRGGVADEGGRRGRRARRRDRVRRLHLRRRPGRRRARRAAGPPRRRRGRVAWTTSGLPGDRGGPRPDALASADPTPGRSPRRAVRGGAGGGSMDGCATRRPRT